MRRAALLAALPFILCTPPLAARETVDASPPTALAVTLYRDPGRGAQEEMKRDWPQGFAMITETRVVTLPRGESTIRFTGVAEGMVAVSAIVTGLPGGTIEKNRNADLLSPAALIDGTLGNRVRVTRTDPATGKRTAENAIVRTRADGGLVLQTRAGFEAVRCSGLPERLTFDRVPAGLSPQPVFTLDTRDRRGGTYTVQLTYLAWGFDWQAHYVVTLKEPSRADDVRLRLTSWLTLLNDNGQSFSDAELLVVAGRLSVVSDFEELAAAPEARALSLTCYPLGSTAAGSPVEEFRRLPLPRGPSFPSATIEVTALRREGQVMYSAASVDAISAEDLAQEEALGDLKLYRVPGQVTVAAKSLKQIAFLHREDVEARLIYVALCSGYRAQTEAEPATMLLATVNDEQHGLGVALPRGGLTVFEPSQAGELLVGEESMRDYAEGQDVELPIALSRQVFVQCQRPGRSYASLPEWTGMQATLTNANPDPVTVRLLLDAPGAFHLRGLPDTRLKDGNVIVEVSVPGNGSREMSWEVRSAAAAD